MAALADVLLGAAAPTGRLPFTLPFSNFTAARPMTAMAVRPAAGTPGVARLGGKSDARGGRKSRIKAQLCR